MSRPIEPEWRGKITLKFPTPPPLPAKIYANEGSHSSVPQRDGMCAVSYADKNGKYQDQPGLTLPRVISGRGDACVARNVIA